MIIEDLLRNPLHLMMLFLVATMVFGTSKIADAGKHLGRGIKEFKKEMRADDSPESGAHASVEAGPRRAACSSCGEELPGGAKFCLSCGHPVTALTTSHVCPTCHAGDPANARFCNECGTPVGFAPSPQGVYSASH